jgi:hypothetical protein
MFNTSGKVHHSGIQNEKDTVAIINKLNICGETVHHVGGTKAKEDSAGDNTKQSIKLKESLATGSYDYVNTSKTTLLGNHFDSFLSVIKQYRTLPHVITSDDTFVTHIRQQFAALCAAAIDNLTTEQLVLFLTSALITDHSDITHMVITDKSEQKLYVWNPTSHPVVRYLNAGYTPKLVRGNGQSSAKVLFTDNKGTVHDCGLRIRVTSNNGIKAFLGLSKSNRNSQVVLKLQQDKVHKLMGMVSPVVYTY